MNRNPVLRCGTSEPRSSKTLRFFLALSLGSPTLGKQVAVLCGHQRPSGQAHAVGRQASCQRAALTRPAGLGAALWQRVVQPQRSRQTSRSQAEAESLRN